MQVNTQQCGMLRRLLSILYDSLLVYSVLLIATLMLLPATGGEAFSVDNHLYHLYLYSLCFFYFGWQWVHGGQTLGMKAWRIKVSTTGGGSINWAQAAIRFLLATVSCLTCGAGFIWIYFDREALAFHDRFSRTRLILIKNLVSRD